MPGHYAGCNCCGGFKGDFVGVYENYVSTVSSSQASRATVINEFLVKLEDLVVAYATLSEPERTARLNQDADRITGEVARYLHVARAGITACPEQA